MNQLWEENWDLERQWTEPQFVLDMQELQRKIRNQDGALLVSQSVPDQDGKTYTEYRFGKWLLYRTANPDLKPYPSHRIRVLTRLRQVLAYPLDVEMHDGTCQDAVKIWDGRCTAKQEVK